MIVKLAEGPTRPIVAVKEPIIEVAVCSRILTGFEIDGGFGTGITVDDLAAGRDAAVAVRGCGSSVQETVLRVVNREISRLRRKRAANVAASFALAHRDSVFGEQMC